MKGRLTGALAVVVLSCALAASPVDRLQILITVDRNVPELVARLRAELEQLGFRVTLAPRSPRSLEEQARSVGVDAALRVVAGGRGVEVWALNAASRESAVREIVLPTARGVGNANIVAFRAVELVRATFLEVDVRLPEPAPVSTTDDAGVDSATVVASAEPADASTSTDPSDGAPDAPALPPPRPPRPPPRAAPEVATGGSARRFALATGAGIQVSGGVVPPTTNVAASGRVRVTERVALGVVMAASAAGGTIRGPEGASDPRGHIAGVDASYAAALGGQLLLRAGLGGGALWARVPGESATGFVARDDSTIVALPYGLLAAEWWPWDRFGFLVDGRVGVPVPDPEIHFGDRVVGRWGTPVCLATVGASVGLD